MLGTIILQLIVSCLGSLGVSDTQNQPVGLCLRKNLLYSLESLHELR